MGPTIMNVTPPMIQAISCRRFFLSILTQGFAPFIKTMTTQVGVRRCYARKSAPCNPSWDDDDCNNRKQQRSMGEATTPLQYISETAHTLARCITAKTKNGGDCTDKHSACLCDGGSAASGA